jgi:hypothetical protein
MQYAPFLVFVELLNHKNPEDAKKKWQDVPGLFGEARHFSLAGKAGWQ